MTAPMPGIEHRMSRLRAVVVSCLDQRRDFGVQFDNLTVHLSKSRLGLPFQHRDVLGLGTVSQARAVLDQSAACDVQVSENARFPGTRCLRRKIKCHSHSCQHLCIHRIGLGPGAPRLGEPACLKRVHLD